ncbi:2-octaprenyl-6-methoxyphenyl hydroxylase [Avibacterium paragallinarum]|uniref:2-octaprenyl-6-methoxyphenyl hydroxylase n=1 Tax=Avibacterium paragallinarum TaxID=728 RepID=UPI0021F7E8CF|nr:2-octaprenyl-6-methoxyphenyl hydroxylase [Avibacterium paragallinarum]UXN34301.1 2-octaprenyl-6-methoxyphenyl hydroxylase [Avibacterium paragallinarum]
MEQIVHYDVIIVGGAMAGCTLALALSDQTQGKIRIALLEKQAPQNHHQTGFDARCIALSAGSCQQLDRITLPNQQSLWQQLSPLASPIEHIHVSDKGHSGLLEFHAQDVPLSQLGAVVELQQVGEVLLNAMAQYPNIDYFAPVEIEQIQFEKERVKISLKNHRTLFCQLIIGADGTQSLVAKSAQIRITKQRDYQQTAIITNIQVQQPHQQRAFERFTAEGPLALLPMRDRLMSLVWCVKDPSELMTLSDGVFLTRLQQQFGWRLGKLQQCGKRFSYPLALYQADRHIYHRTALVGNAAQTLHPIAGQGFNLGMRDVICLAKLLSQAFMAEQDLGAYSLLSQYETARQADQSRLIHLTNGLVSIFANELLPLQIGRNLGLMALAQSHLLKQQFIKPTLGW